MNLVLLQSGYPIAVIKLQDRSAYIDAIMAWRSGNSVVLTQLIADTILTASVEILSLG